MCYHKGMDWMKHSILLALAFALFFAAPARAQEDERLAAPPDMLEAPATAEIPASGTTTSESETVPAPAAPEDIKGSIVIEGERRLTGEEKAEEIMQAVLEKIRQLPPDIQKEIMDEADRAYANCSVDSMMMNFYDCSCYALTIAGERIDKGPEVPYIELISGTKTGHCVSGPLIAGYVNGICTEVMSLQPVNTSIADEACRCTIKGMISAFRQQPVANMAYVQGLIDEKISQCLVGSLPR